ncbi:lipoprotein [Pontibacter sp. HJ8]
MNKQLTSIAASFLMGSALLLASCGEGGNNSDMPPESTQGNTQETGVEGNGYVMPEDTGGLEGSTTTGSTTGTTAGTTTGTTTGSSTTGTTAGTTNGTTAGTTAGSTTGATTAGSTTGGSTTGGTTGR